MCSFLTLPGAKVSLLLPPNLLLLQSPCDVGSLIFPHHLLGSLFLMHHSCGVGNLGPSQVSSQHQPVCSPCSSVAIASLLPLYSASSSPESATHLGICQPWLKAALRATSTCISTGKVCFRFTFRVRNSWWPLDHSSGSHLHTSADTPLPGMLFPFSPNPNLLCS